MLTLKPATQVISSSPFAQSFFPSHAWSIGMNFTECLQKKYLLSISCLTAGKRSGTLAEKDRTEVRATLCLDDLIDSHIILSRIHLCKTCVTCMADTETEIWCNPVVYVYFLGGGKLMSGTVTHWSILRWPVCLVTPQLSRQWATLSSS